MGMPLPRVALFARNSGATQRDDHRLERQLVVCWLLLAPEAALRHCRTECRGAFLGLAFFSG